MLNRGLSSAAFLVARSGNSSYPRYGYRYRDRAIHLVTLPSNIVEFVGLIKRPVNTTLHRVNRRVQFPAAVARDEISTKSARKCPAILLPLSSPLLPPAMRPSRIIARNPQKFSNCRPSANSLSG